MKTNAFLFIVILLSACSKKKTIVTKFEDYQSYLQSVQVDSSNPIDEEIKFWQERLDKDKNDEASLVKLAGLHASLFKSSGLIEHLLTSDSLYHHLLKVYPAGNPELYQSLAANAIAQHQFKRANEFVQKALTLNDKKAASLLLLVDVSLELGDYAQANILLKDFTNKNSFAYLIREAKVKDHEGNIDSAIVRMERAYERIKGNRSLSQWTLSNLGDMYGHAGRIEEAYHAYLTVLKENPHDDYVLKGIAWIALSNDHNTRDAKTIIQNIATRKRMPEAHLMLAEISEMEGNERERLDHLEKFRSMVSAPDYRTMYHKYLATLEAEDLNNAEAAVEIAKKEIQNRPTPQSYDLLAWGYYHQKKYSHALEIISRHVQDQTFEPESYYHIGIIYAANGYKEQARHYLMEALDSEFELGPSTTKKIRAAIQNL